MRPTLEAQWLSEAGQSAAERVWQHRWLDGFHTVQRGTLFTVKADASSFEFVLVAARELELWTPTPCCGSVQDGIALYHGVDYGPALAPRCTLCERRTPIAAHTFVPEPTSVRSSLTEILEEWWSWKAGPLIPTLHADELVHRVNRVISAYGLAGSDPGPGFLSLLRHIGGPL